MTSTSKRAAGDHEERSIGSSMFPDSAATIAGVYREFAAPPDLGAHVACVWTSVSRGGVVFPDGCVDLVWRGDGLVLAGPATEPMVAGVPVGVAVVGVGFPLGAAGAAAGAAPGGVAGSGVRGAPGLAG